jgi:hypothetical protein
MAAYSGADLEVLLLLRRAFSWRISLERCSGVWVASFGGERIRHDDPLRLFDELALAAEARRGAYLRELGHEPTDTESGDSAACTCCQERLEQLGAIIHEANAEILARLEETEKHLARLAAFLREHLAGVAPGA